jgi:RimJ/RimL family protein N-acetyltransferase
MLFEVKTERLNLRDILEKDWEVMHRLRSDPEVTRYFETIKSVTEEETKAWVRGTIHHNSLDPRSSYNLAIIRQSDHKILGWIGIGQADGEATSVLDFGYAILPTYWGCGYATEALSGIVDFAFEQLNTEQIFGECDRNNLASARVMENAGLRRIAPQDQYAEEDLQFVIFRKDWMV